METNPLLTVIVPCYNVEKYVDKCISSIVNQTYQNIEILLIDDGSIDSTGTICDAWQEKDKRIRVIHKQNEGLPYARKTGLENAKTDYITFVDADDWIDDEMYANMMTLLINTGSDIAQCGVCMVYEDGQVKHMNNEHKTGDYEIFGRVESVLLLVENRQWRSWMWNKIFKKHLFDDVVFPKDRGYSEDFVSLYAFHKANQSVYTYDEYCFYFQRYGSISYADNIQKCLKNHTDLYDAWYERYNFILKHPEYHSAITHLKFWTLVLGICLLRNLIVHNKYHSRNYFYDTAKQLRSFSLNSNDKLKGFIKTEFYILKISPILYKFFRWTYVVMIKITNKLKITTNRQTDSMLSHRGIWLILEKGNAL